MYPFCPSPVHHWGQGWVGVSLAALAAPAVQTSASSQMGLSYVLWTAVCSQRAPFLGINGAARPPSAHSCLALLTSTPSSFPTPLFWYISLYILISTGGLHMVQVSSTTNCGQQRLCMSLHEQSFLGLALVSFPLQEPLPQANQGFQVCSLGSLAIRPQWCPKCLLIHI